MTGVWADPITLTKVAEIVSAGKKTDLIDEIDGDGSSFVTGKAIDFTKTINNEDFKCIDIDCIDICDVVKAVQSYQKIILKLDVKGAEYEILDRLLKEGLLGCVDKLHVEWHWTKMGMSDEEHQGIYQQVQKYCCIKDWDALDMSIHTRDSERHQSRMDLLESVLGKDLSKYQKNSVIEVLNNRKEI